MAMARRTSRLPSFHRHLVPTVARPHHLSSTAGPLETSELQAAVAPRRVKKTQPDLTGRGAISAASSGGRRRPDRSKAREIRDRCNQRRGNSDGV
jgi:hypothetical protein